MKHINILSLVHAFRSLQKEDYQKFLSYYGIKMKDEEVKDLTSLLELFYELINDVPILTNFYVGYAIPQIDKEFDLLRFGETFIINIELKSISTKDKILKQLIQNRYYLNFIDKEIYNFTFVRQEKKFYCLNNNELEEVNIKKLGDLISKQKVKNIDNVDNFFNPSDYLVSPFNSTKKFIESKYFLTQQQESVKNKIIKSLSSDTKANFFAIKGSAGTGKTLLTYDVAKELIKNKKKVLIIHCGSLNDGQIKLNNILNWKIIEIKNYKNYTLSDYDLIIIDEAQRIYPNQFESIVEIVQKNNGNCIFSYDKVQTLSIREENNDIDDKIKKITSIKTEKLTEKIRTNKELSLLIKRLFNNKNNQPLLSKDNIEISYFDNNNAIKFLDILNSKDWKVLRFTPSQYKNEKHEECALSSSETSHEIIGQEFDNVVVIIDECFFYNQEGKLQYRCSSYYHPVKMLFQNLTRTRKKIHIVIVNNTEVLNRCLSILK